MRYILITLYSDIMRLKFPGFTHLVPILLYTSSFQLDACALFFGVILLISTEGGDLFWESAIQPFSLIPLCLKRGRPSGFGPGWG